MSKKQIIPDATAVERANSLFDRLEHFANEGARRGDLRKVDVQELCEMLRDHVRAYRERTGVFGSLTET